MRSVNLVSESPFFKEEDFQVVELYGKEVVAFDVTEQNFISNSIVFGLFDGDLNPLPHASGQVSLFGYAGNKRYFIEDEEIYIVLDKGTIGFESTTIVSRCQITKTDTEFVIGIMLETNETAVKRLTEVFENRVCGVSGMLHAHLMRNVSSTNPAPIPEIIKRTEETPFLDANNDQCAGIPLLFQPDGEYSLGPRPSYKVINNEGKITKGALLYSLPMHNAVEILEVTGFAHSLYGDFFALVRVKYIYPRDDEAIKTDLPKFYKEQCLFDSERRLREFIGTPESIAYIPSDSKIGDNEIYQELMVVDGSYGVSDNIFQFTYNSSPHGFFDCASSCSGMLPVAVGSVLGTLTEAGGQYKIWFYRCTKVVKDKNKYYVHFMLDDDSGYFRDFSNAGKRTFKKCQHRDACRNVEYLLCTGKISPVPISPAPCI